MMCWSGLWHELLQEVMCVCVCFPKETVVCPCFLLYIIVAQLLCWNTGDLTQAHTEVSTCFFDSCFDAWKCGGIASKVGVFVYQATWPMGSIAHGFSLHPKMERASLWSGSSISALSPLFHTNLPTDWFLPVVSAPAPELILGDRWRKPWETLPRLNYTEYYNWNTFLVLAAKTQSWTWTGALCTYLISVVAFWNIVLFAFLLRFRLTDWYHSLSKASWSPQ